ncbi:unnamed protein product [Symbiodinium pilosum]|uniref:YhfC family intramembrane metalloprotease n=1 Tax=Symbiodinium pilosum TaxID=2952 RepID=A0A812T6U3_SYMPI|nr:unnamed protein product [Symbiodinium pilosum]
MQDYTPLPSEEEIEEFSRKVRCCLPFVLISIAPFLAAYYWMNDARVDWVILLWGAGGWWAALVFRVPFILGTKALLTDSPSQQAELQLVTVLLSGPAEESIRVAMLFVSGWAASFTATFALGLGWTALELAFTVVQSITAIQLLRAAKAGDPKAVEAFHLLAAQTGREDPLSLHPAWGILERCSAHALHISMSLFGAISPWMVLGTLTVHSAINWSTVACLRMHGPVVAEVGLCFVSSALLLAALRVWHPFAI